MNIGDVVSIDKLNDLRIVFDLDGDIVYVKPINYESTWYHKFSINRITLATDEQIKYYLSTEIRRSYLANIANYI